MKPTAFQQFENERRERLQDYRQDEHFQRLSLAWLEASMARKYVYNFDWLGRPIIQYPQDMVIIQELVWKVRPDLIIETGIAHGGSLVLSASLLALLDLADAITAGSSCNPKQSRRRVVGVDIDIRSHNREAIETHPLSCYMEMIQGSSIDADVVEKVQKLAGNFKTVMVLLDSMHTHDHVLAELNAYAHLVTPESYCVVFDTFVEDMPRNFFSDRPWNVGNNPRTAVESWLPRHPEFEVDPALETKLQVTVAPHGFLYRKQ